VAQVLFYVADAPPLGTGPTQSEIAYIDVTVTGLDTTGVVCGPDAVPFPGGGLQPIFTQSVQISVISVNPPVGPPPDKPIPGQNPSGVPIPTTDSIFTLAGKAIILLSIAFVVFGLYLFFNSDFNARIGREAVRWVKTQKLA
jgi:hypothetical protein